MRRFATAITFLAPASLAVIAAGCGGSGTGPSAPAYGATHAAAKSTTIEAGRTSLGTVLVDTKGRTLYLFEKDKATRSTCNGACASVWPPLTTVGAPRAGHGVLKTKLGSIKRGDGDSEVTYAGHPLYTFAGDAKAGDVRGQDLDQFGAPWYVLKPSGQKIDPDEG